MLKNIEPSDVFTFFEEISKIPHGSGNTAQISDYLVKFAEKENLEYYRDDAGNVIIIKEATPGYENCEPIMLQGHMDMVAVKKPNADIDMKKDGLKLQTDGDWLFAENTSLGGDDGIAVAMGLALLHGTSYKHPRVELVITVDEEVGMEGAKALDVSPLKAKKLINLDSEDEGIFIAGCAGGAIASIEDRYTAAKAKGLSYQLTISGLLGGHSGGEIHKEHGNAICLLGRLLCKLNSKIEFSVHQLQGGIADNAIPIYANAAILVTGYDNLNGKQEFGSDGFSMQECQALLNHLCEKESKDINEELLGKEDQATIELYFEEVGERECVPMEQSVKLIHLINSLPHGIQAMNLKVPGMVETSLNPGILYLREGKFGVEMCVRSAMNSARDALLGRLDSIARLAAAKIRIYGVYPGWNYKQESPLRNKMTEVFEQLYGRKPVVEIIHAGVECGLLADKIPGLDVISIGPDMKGIHTTEEKLSISSTGRVWNYLLKLLEVQA